jgi:hypothetical protein
MTDRLGWFVATVLLATIDNTSARPLLENNATAHR